MEKYKEDFIRQEPVEKIIKGRKFLIRELGGEEADKLMNDYVTVNEDTEKLEADLAKRNKLYIETCVVDAPYEKDGKPFKELKPEEKSALMNNLRASIRTPLMKAINDLNSAGGGVEKNSTRQS